MKSNGKKQREEELLAFMKEAFCVDGEVKIITGGSNRFKIEIVIELNDSKRGKFYIGHLLLEEDKTKIIKDDNGESKYLMGEDLEKWNKAIHICCFNCGKQVTIIISRENIK